MSKKNTEDGVVGVVDLSLTFPDFLSPKIDRPYLLETIDSIFNAGLDCVVLEGAEQIGKTYLAAQFARLHAKSCFSIFLGSFDNVAAHQSQVCFDLGNQINWFITSRSLDISSNIGSEEFRNLIFILQRKVRSENSTVYFVLDGVDSALEVAPGLSQFLASMLPMGAPGFRFVLSGSSSLLSGSRAQARYRPHTVSAFTPSESQKFLADTGLDADEALEVHKIFRGVPGHLATARRLISSGYRPSDILNMSDEGIPDIFQPEWDRIDALNIELLKALSAVAFLSECVDIDCLASIMKISVEKVVSLLGNISFISLDYEKKKISFVSEIFQKYARRKLSSFENETIDLAINRLGSLSSEAKSLQLLPEYLQRRGRLTELDAYLTSNRISQSVISRKSVSMTLRMLASIEEQAFDAGEEPVALKCLLSRVVLSDVVPPDLLEARIEAALAQKDDSLAVSLANSAELDEQRLALLSIVGRSQRTRGTEADPSVIDEIRRISTNINFESLGERAIDIAADLAFCVPDLAARALESFSSKSSNSLDLAIVRSTMKALRGAVGDGEEKSVFAEVDKLNRSGVAKKIMKNVALLWQTADAATVLQGISTLSTTSEQLFFARQWLRVNFRCVVAMGVALGVTRIMLADTSYAPNAKLFRDLSLPLIGFDNSVDAHRLISFLDGQSDFARSKGPLTDYFRMRFRLAEARFRFLGDKALLNFEDEALAISDVKDVATRAACYAWLIRSLRNCGVGSEVQDSIGLFPYAHSEMRLAVSRLLQETADHNEATQEVLRALARTDTDEAIDIVAGLNTEYRRDEGYECVGGSLLSGYDGDARKIIEIIYNIISRMSDPFLRQRLSVQLITWVCDSQNIDNIDGDIDFCFAVDLLIDPDVRARCISAILLKNNKKIEKKENKNSLFDEMIASWRKIEDDRVKVRAGYRVIANLGGAQFPGVREFSDEVDRLAESAMPLLGMQETWRRMVLLYGRSLAALAAVRCVNSDDIDIIERFANNILSEVERARYLARCSMYVAQTDVDLAKDIIQKYVAPRVAQVMSVDPGRTTEVKRMMADVAPALWLCHAPSALRYLADCDHQTQQFGLKATLDYLIKNKIPGEPWKWRVKNRQPINERILNDVIVLLEEVESDEILCGAIEDLAECCRDRHAGGRINVNQKANLVSRLEEMVARKLPCKRGIQHDGYIIYAKAQLMSLGNRNHPEWKGLINQAYSIPNLSDSCYVLSLLCDVIPRRFDDLRRDCFYKVRDLWSKLPTTEERLARLEVICNRCSKHYEAEVRSMLKEALGEFSPESNPGAANKFRSLVELAYRIDEEWAASLVSVTDTDPARMMARGDASRRLKQLSIQDKLSARGSDVVAKSDLRDLVEACWSELGVLNASRVPRFEWDGIIDLLKRTKNASLAEAYPIISLALATVSSRYSGGQGSGAQEKVQRVHTAVREAAEVLLGLGVSRPGDSIIPRNTELLDEHSYMVHMVEPGKRTEAFSALSEWLRKNNPDVLDIVDPYFRPSDEEALILFARACPQARIRVLTSMHAQEGDCSPAGVSQSLNQAWVNTGLGGDPPRIAMYVVGRDSDGHMGIHDRWWLAETSGLEFGTSINGLGRDKVSAIRAIDSRELGERRKLVDPYFQMLKRSHDGERLNYITAVI